VLRDSPTLLTTPQIMARIGLTKVPTRLHLTALEETGQIGKVAGTPYRWYWRADAHTAQSA
jgi:hypothetical protein